MATARALLQAHIDGLTSVALTPVSIPITTAWWLEDAAGDIDILNLASGSTTLTMPPKATMLILIPPPTNVTSIVLKGAAGDTGVALSPNSATVLALAVTPLVLTTTAAITGVRTIWL